MVLPERFENWQVSSEMAILCDLMSPFSRSVSANCVGKCVVDFGLT